MDANSYSAEIVTDATPEAAFAAVASEMDKWWTTSVEGRFEKPGDKVKVVFPPDFGHWTFKATRMEAPSRIEMECVDARHRVPGQPRDIDREWEGTVIVWEFRGRGAGSEVRMHHRGLTPQLKCWDICVDGWNFFFRSSLKDYLDGKPASPHRTA